MRLLVDREREGQHPPPTVGMARGGWDKWPTFLARAFTDSRGHMLSYRMLMPVLRSALIDPMIRESDLKQMPLVLLLHGAGERGDDNSAQLRNGVAELLGSETAAAHFPCFYVVPQCAEEHQWVKVAWNGNTMSCPDSYQSLLPWLFLTV